MSTKTSDNGKAVTPKQDAAIVMLLSCGDVNTAARTAGVHKRTLQRWLADSGAFQREYERRRREAFDLAIGRLNRLCGKAVSKLEALLDDDATPAHVLSSVALGVLKLARESVELDDLRRRVDDLEAALDEDAAPAPAFGFREN